MFDSVAPSVPPAPADAPIAAVAQAVGALSATPVEPAAVPQDTPSLGAASPGTPSPNAASPGTTAMGAASVDRPPPGDDDPCALLLGAPPEPEPTASHVDHAATLPGSASSATASLAHAPRRGRPRKEPAVSELVSTSEWVQRIASGQAAAESIPSRVRRDCVRHLTLQGFTNSDICELMRISERTVRRDRIAIREEEALTPSLHFGDEALGEFQRLTLASVQRLSRMASDPSNPPYARLWAEDALGRVYQRFIDTARKLGYIDGGGNRMHHLRRTDPGEIRRKQECLEAMLTAYLPPPRDGKSTDERIADFARVRLAEVNATGR